MYVKELKEHEIPFAFESDEMVRLTNGFEVDRVFCFDFNISVGKDVYLQRMHDYFMW